MEVIPGINCPDFGCVREKINQARELGAEWVHIDVTDGRFAKHTTWNNPEDLSSLADELGDLKLEIHLMVLDPQAVIGDWLQAGCDRIIVHFEALSDGWEIICDKVEREGRELGLAISPETPTHVLTPYLKAVSLVELLAVAPGPAGQKFNPVIIEKLKDLKKREPDLRVEVDGGVNLETAKLLKYAGADIVVSTSYIWKGGNPKETFDKLRNL
ncbi:MAG: ribulose-phosphate 3-epimerase [Candidatus Jorgensenbacteria bacterium]